MAICTLVPTVLPSSLDRNSVETLNVTRAALVIDDVMVRVTDVVCLTSTLTDVSDSTPDTFGM